MTIPMPEPVILRTVMPDDYRYGHVYGFTRRQMEAYADSRVRGALEEILTISTDTRYISDIENKISEMLGVLK